MYVRALHTVHALDDLRVVGGRLRDRSLGSTKSSTPNRDDVNIGKVSASHNPPCGLVRSTGEIGARTTSFGIRPSEPRNSSIVLDR